jgi:hypothetical protein
VVSRYQVQYNNKFQDTPRLEELLQVLCWLLVNILFNNNSIIKIQLILHLMSWWYQGIKLNTIVSFRIHFILKSYFKFFVDYCLQSNSMVYFNAYIYTKIWRLCSFFNLNCVDYNWTYYTKGKLIVPIEKNSVSLVNIKYSSSFVMSFWWSKHSKISSLFKLVPKCFIANIVLTLPFPYILIMLFPYSCATLASMNHGLPNNME